MIVLDEADLDSSVGDFTSELEEVVRTSVKESPLLTFAAAGGLGFVLGGGLTIGVMTRLLRAGLRVAFTIRAKALTDWLANGQRPAIPMEPADMGYTNEP
jgi:hypothetical protein